MSTVNFSNFNKTYFRTKLFWGFFLGGGWQNQGWVQSFPISLFYLSALLGGHHLHICQDISGNTRYTSYARYQHVRFIWPSSWRVRCPVLWLLGEWWFMSNKKSFFFSCHPSTRPTPKRSLQGFQKKFLGYRPRQVPARLPHSVICPMAMMLSTMGIWWVLSFGWILRLFCFLLDWSLTVINAFCVL